MLDSLPSPSPSPPLATNMSGWGRRGKRRETPRRPRGQKGDTLDITSLTPEKKAELLLLLQTDKDNGDTHFNGVSGHSRKRTVKDTSLTASPASPPQSSATKRVTKKSKKGDSASLSFRDIGSASVADKTTTASTTERVDPDSDSSHTQSDSDSSSILSQVKHTAIPSVSVSQPKAVGVESQAARERTPHTRIAPTDWMSSRLQWHSLLTELVQLTKDSQGRTREITVSDQFSALVSFLAPPQEVVVRDESEEMVIGILKLAQNGQDEKGGIRAMSALIHQTGIVLSQRGLNRLPATLQEEYANRVHRPALTNTATIPAISHFLRVNDSSIGLTLTQKLVTTGYTAVVTPGGGTCGAASLLIGLIGHTSEPLELAIREVGHKAVTKILNTRMEAVEESQRGERRLAILRDEFGLSQKATEEEWSSDIRKRDVALEVSELSAITAALGVKLKLFVYNPDGLPEPQLLGAKEGEVTVQVIHRGAGSMGGHYAAIVRQGLSEAPLSEADLKKLILKVDADIVVPEKVREDKATVNSDFLGTYAPHGQAISTIYPHIKYIREFHSAASRENPKFVGPSLKSNSLHGAWSKGTPVVHPGGNHPADVQGCINHTLGKCRKDSGCRYLHLKVKCRFEQQFGKCGRSECSFGHTEGAKLRVCRYFQSNTCTREPCRFEHKVLDRGVCWSAYEQHCRHGASCRYRHLDLGGIP